MTTAASEYDMDARDEGLAASTTPATSDAPPVWVSVAAGAAVGLAVGGALALLFAPKPGSELRAELGERVDDLRDRAERTMDTLQESAADLIVRSRTTLEETRENLVRSIEAGKDAYEHKRDELTARLDSGDSSGDSVVNATAGESGGEAMI